MTQNAKLLAAGLAGGYLLGRTKKGKIALVLGSYVLGKRKGLHPQQLILDGLKKLSDSPEFSRLEEQLRSELMAAGRSLVTAAANRRLDSLSDALRDRTDALSAVGGAAGEPEKPEDTAEQEEPREQADDETEDRRSEEDRDDEGSAGKAASKPSPGKKASEGTARKTADKTAGKAAGKKASQGQSAAKKTAARTSRPAAKKSATRPTGRR